MNNVKSTRISKGLTQKQLAEMKHKTKNKLSCVL